MKRTVYCYLGGNPAINDDSCCERIIPTATYIEKKTKEKVFSLLFLAGNF